MKRRGFGEFTRAAYRPRSALTFSQLRRPFQWAFTPADLVALLTKLKAKELGRVA